MNGGASTRKAFFGHNSSKKNKDGEETKPDTQETIHISALALLKMLKHGRAGVPLEVMGLMLGQIIDDYTIHVVDVFAMPQTASGISVEAIDSVFQTQMLDMLKRIGRQEVVVGWYHSHPGFGCWLSSVDCQTQSSFENLQSRSVAVVVDPIQSVRGKVVIDAFRSINTLSILGNNTEVRNITSNLGHVRKAPIIILRNLNKPNWTKALRPFDYEENAIQSLNSIKNINNLLKLYETYSKQEGEMTSEAFSLMNVGRKDPRKHLAEIASNLLKRNINQQLVGSISSVAFQTSFETP